MDDRSVPEEDVAALQENERLIKKSDGPDFKRK